MFAQTADSSTLSCRKPTAEDGATLHSLIEQCPPLDQNSMYCNLLQCTHFAQTAAIAEVDERLVGSVTGFLHPEKKDTWFIWQIAVSQEARGQRITQRLIDHVLKRKGCQDIRFIETSITQSNTASWAVFEKLAQRLGAPIVKQALFDQRRHFDGKHPSEALVRIGPIPDLARSTPSI